MQTINSINSSRNLNTANATIWEARKSRLHKVPRSNVVTEIISRRPISGVWVALGGDPPKRGRTRAFFRDGENNSAVSLNDTKGCWIDYASGAHGGVLSLIQHVRGWQSRFGIALVG